MLYTCGWKQNKKVTSKVIKAQTGSKDDRIKQPASVTTVCRQKGKAVTLSGQSFGSRPDRVQTVKGLPLLSLRVMGVTLDLVSQTPT